MQEDKILVVGDVSRNQCQTARLVLLDLGKRPRIKRATHEQWDCFITKMEQLIKECEDEQNFAERQAGCVQDEVEAILDRDDYDQFTHMGFSPEDIARIDLVEIGLVTEAGERWAEKKKHVFDFLPSELEDLFKQSFEIASDEVGAFVFGPGLEVHPNLREIIHIDLDDASLRDGVATYYVAA